MTNIENIDNVEIKELIKASVEKVSDKFPDKMVPMIEEALLKINQKGLTPSEAVGISKEVIEEMYNHGYHFFQSGKFKEALTIFNILARLVGGRDPRFTFAIAASHHHLKNYKEAVAYYTLYQVIQPKNPLSYYHLFDCFKQLNNLSLALVSLEKAEELALLDDKNKEWAGKIGLELKALKTAERSV